MTGFEHALTSGWTPGAIGIWTLVAGAFGMWWKGLPAVIEMLDKRRVSELQSAREFLEEERDRFKQLTDEMDGRVAALRAEVDALRKENGELRGLLAAMQQGQLAVQSVVARTIKEAKEHDH